MAERLYKHQNLILRTGYMHTHTHRHTQRVNVAFISSDEVMKWEPHPGHVNSWLRLSPECFFSVLPLSLSLETSSLSKINLPKSLIQSSFSWLLTELLCLASYSFWPYVLLFWLRLILWLVLSSLVSTFFSLHHLCKTAVHTHHLPHHQFFLSCSSYIASSSAVLMCVGCIPSLT